MLATISITAAEPCTTGLDIAVVLNKEQLSTTAERKSAISSQAEQMTGTWSKFLIQDTDGNSEHGQPSSGYMHNNYRRSLATLLAPNRSPCFHISHLRARLSWNTESLMQVTGRLMCFLTIIMLSTHMLYTQSKRQSMKSWYLPSGHCCVESNIQFCERPRSYDHFYQAFGSGELGFQLPYNTLKVLTSNSDFGSWQSFVQTAVTVSRLYSHPQITNTAGAKVLQCHVALKKPYIQMTSCETAAAENWI